MDVRVAPCFLLILENTYVEKNQVKMKNITFFSRKRYTVTVTVYQYLLFVVPSIVDFRSIYRKLAENIRYTFFWQFWIKTSHFCQKEVHRDSKR